MDKKHDEILIVEDDPGLADLIAEAILGLDCEVFHASCGEAAIERISTMEPDLMILDYSLNDMTAAQLLDKISARFGKIPPFIVSTGAGDERIAVEMMKRNARDYIVKDSLFLEMLPSLTSKALKEIKNENALNRMKEEIRGREVLLQTVFEAAKDIAFIICDMKTPNLNIIEFSPGAESIFGFSRSEIMGMSICDLYRGGILPENDESETILYGLGNIVAHGKHEVEMIRKNGQPFTSLFTVYPIYDQEGRLVSRLDVIIDITERKRDEEERDRLETRVQNMQKLESLGILAGGIAHDFNNLLMAILGHAGLAMSRIKDDSVILKNLEEIEKASVRAGELCNQMLAYAGKSRMIAHPFNLADTVNDMKMMIDAAVSKKIRIIRDWGPVKALVNADSTQIKQVVMNLVVNAAEAIGDDHGIIRIEIGISGLDKKSLEEMWLGEAAAPGQYVYLRVSDNGCGMDPDRLKKVFDPFFSTKFAGRGLGLAALLGIVKAHGGVISLSSEPGKGTVFTVYFNQYADEYEVQRSSLKDEVGTNSCHGMVLLVDDEDAVRGVGGAMLESVGFDVVLARDGKEAIDIFRQRSETIDCILLDLAMPNMDGVETYEEIRKIRKNAVVVLSSGYSEYEIECMFKGSGYAGFIQKPYKISDLSNKIFNAIKYGK